MSGLDTLQEWATRIRALPAVLAAEGPQIVAEAMQGAMGEAVSAGRSLDGSGWKPRVEDGAKPFSNGMKYVSTRVLGRVALITLQGPMAFAQFGTGKMASRPLLPAKGLPTKLGNAIAKGIVAMGEGWITRGGRHDKGAGKMWK